MASAIADVLKSCFGSCLWGQILISFQVRAYDLDNLDLDLENERVDASSNSDHDDDAEHAPDTLNTFDISKMPEDMREHYMAQMAQFRAYMV